MTKKGYISEFVGGGRVVSHGQITDLTKGFRLESGNPFSVYVRPKEGVASFDCILSVRCYQDDEFSDAPVTFYDWSPLAICEIAPSEDEDLLKTYDIFWGSGAYEGGAE